MKLALWQTHPRASIAPALTALKDAARSAAAQGADLLVTPEMFLGGYNIGPDRIALHADQSVEVLDQLRAIAKAEGIAIATGLALPGSHRPLNACVVLDSAGQEIARYHKTHLFGAVDRAQFDAGAALSSVFDLCGWKVALAICYDVEFPELVRALALLGADLIVAPTANMAPFDSVATRLVTARAEENAIYMAYANYVGMEGQFAYNGLSCVVGPNGEDCVRGADREDMLFAILNREMLAETRQTQTHLADRRPDLYLDIS